jgi:hypothetical protein
MEDKEWEEQLPLAKDEIIPFIFEGSCFNQIPLGFNAITIYLDGQIQSDLDWREAKKQAKESIDQGYKILWDLHLGLFDGLKQSIGNQTQFLSLILSLEHFRDFLWEELQEHTIGISLFRGNIEWHRNFPWDDEQQIQYKEWLKKIGKESFMELTFRELNAQKEGKRLLHLFCRETLIEYIELLAARLPETLTPYIFLNATPLATMPVPQLEALHPELFKRIQIVVKGHTLPLSVVGWQSKATIKGYSGCISVQPLLTQDIKVGVSLPSLLIYESLPYEEIIGAISLLQEKKIPLVLIPESQLTSNWDGLDYVIYSPSGLSAQGKRALRGFCAAGGAIIPTDSKLDTIFTSQIISSKI